MSSDKRSSTAGWNWVDQVKTVLPQKRNHFLDF